MPPSVYDGAPTKERHDHYMPDGTPTGYTLVTRESPWTDQDRAEVEALHLLPSRQSPTGCGHSMKDATDRRSWKARTFVCEACRQSAIVQRHFADEHEGAKPDRDGALPSDGFAAWVVPPDTPDEEG